MLGLVWFQHDPYTRTILALAIVFALAYLVGRLFKKMGQPEVIGEILVGILLGPSLLGGFSKTLFPVAGRPMLQILADIGVAIFMFTVGLEMDLARVRAERHHTVATTVALSGIIVPFALGVAAALLLHRLDPRVSLLPFCLFVGISLSITAFPVLARILKSRGLEDKPIGELCLLSAAMADALTWIVLAAVVAVAGSHGWTQAPYELVAALGLVVVLVVLVRPVLVRFSDRTISPPAMLLIFAGIMACAAFASGIGFHEIFGAFAFGAIFPKGALADRVRKLLEPICILLLPIFFITTGLSVDIRSVGSDGVWAFFLILAVACIGKIGGAGFGAFAHRLGLRDSAGIGALMNTRGLTELIILTVGLQAKIINPELFTVFVFMAIVTTAMTSPLLSWIKPNPFLQRNRTVPNSVVPHGSVPKVQPPRIT